MDPATLAMLISAIGAGGKIAGGITGILGGNEGVQAQQRLLGQSLAGLEAGHGERLGAAGGLRFDQFGNATYYDPNQRRWITSYTPEQQRLIDEGQARQERANVRGAQASEDYAKLRGEYLYQKPKTEAESYAELLNLIQGAQGRGDRALETLVNRQYLRQRGNMPVINATQYGEKAPGQQLAAQMLQARSGALDESIKREAAHQSQYLPALQAMERTANTIVPLDPTGSVIKQMEGQGRSDVLAADSDYEKLLGQLFTQGGQNVAHSYDTLIKGAAVMGGGGSNSNNLSSLAAALARQKQPGTIGNTTGATYNSGGNYGNIVQAEHPYSKLIGTDAAPLGGALPEPKDYTYGGGNDPFSQAFGNWGPNAWITGDKAGYAKGYSPAFN